jgi:hypothetical protein
MKTTCILNMVALAIVLACNFELSDLPYFKGITRNAWVYITNLFKQQKKMKTSSLSI